MKTIEVTVRRVTYTTYDVEVEDDFDADARGAAYELECRYFDLKWGSDDFDSYEEVASWEIDSIEDNNDTMMEG